MHRAKSFFNSTSQREIKTVDFTRKSEGSAHLAKPAWCTSPEETVQQWWPSDRVAPTRAPEPEPEPIEHHPEPEAEPSPAMEAAFETARELGFETGLEEGRQQAQVEARDALAEEVEALRAVAKRFAQELDALGRLRRMMMDEAEAQMVALSLDVGQRLACEAQLTSTDWVAPLIRQAAEALTEADRVTCRMSPALAVRMDQDEAWPDIQGMVFEIAPELDELDIVVESRFGRVDASFRERLEHLERAVRERVEKVTASLGEQDVA